jgi:hypothetical protein
VGPITLEECAGLGHWRTSHRKIQIAKIELTRGIKIFVTDVAPTPDDQVSIRDPGLVVHAMINAVAGEQELDNAAQGAELERVEQADIDAWVVRYAV